MKPLVSNTDIGNDLTISPLIMKKLGYNVISVMIYIVMWFPLLFILQYIET